MFAAFNSGAARHHSGRPAKRDLKAHRASGLFRGSPADVVELVWEDELVLPTATQVGRTPSGPWLPLFPTAA
jgi:hypothetical protein